MIEITPKAAQLMSDYFKDKDNRPIRIFVRMGGCGIRTFGVAMEEPKKSDEIFEIDGFTYIVNRKLLKMIQPIKVDSDGYRFRISGTGVDSSSGCSSCGIMCGVRKGGRCLGDCGSCDHKCNYRYTLMRKRRTE
ncbi:MAG: IscA/HesB family protein [Deltaproteobacteria bacterium]|nr:IscA/HesB family protein [Deltaproteobacteria bacterium]